MAGLALAIASLGWSWENAGNFNGTAQYIGAAIGGVMLLLIASKFLLSPKNLWADLQHPVVGSVVPTFAMGVMIVSSALGKWSPMAGDTLWVFAVAMHLTFLTSFVYHRAKSFSLSHMVPSWFVPPVGLVVADVAFSGNPALRPVADAILIFGLLSYAVLLPMMIYRLIFCGEVPDGAKPTIAIMAAPASLSLAGYLTVSQSPSPVIVAVLLGIALLMTAVIYVSFAYLMRLPFSPGFAAFTFPMVIGATALYKTATWMQSIGMAPEYVNQISVIALIELVVATVVVGYVSLHYRRFISLQWKQPVAA
ncbi:C4-dicarboxylate ABC transporter [Enterovibrio norvegicus FF-454]|uniref:C4-dicarboxylate ABC transporter n=1 Tax=Enterovibrio norvegicus FF-454 TaxID=1185651 RepID=A0A1E5CA95_9GAMM|nr:TDT family transporter [Enterovibrio norvegicus]OEE62396.1 C4-dicarboxylate ABC transporter [Enterovibrio norvegicus FF-454]